MRQIIKICVAATFVFSCSNSDNTPDTAPPGSVMFEFVQTSHDERFKARTSNPAVIEAARMELRKPLEERTLHINGALARGDGGVNRPWSWRFVDDDWSMTEFSIELCDSWPSFVEENLDSWMKEVGAFCPWSSRVYAEH